MKKILEKVPDEEKGKFQAADKLKVQEPGFCGISTTRDKSFEQLLKIPVAWRLTRVKPKNIVMKKKGICFSALLS